MTTTKPYLIRAIHEWAMDNDLTPQILVSAQAENVRVPMEYVKDGHIAFNIHLNAVKDLNLTNDWVFFSARFSGKPMNIEVPVEAVLAIYARENGQGIFFQEDEVAKDEAESESSSSSTVGAEQPAPTTTPAPDPNKPKKPKKSHLKLVK